MLEPAPLAVISHSAATALKPPAPAIRASSSRVNRGRPAGRGGRVMMSGSAGSRSKAIEADRSMNSSSHRTWIGRSAWLNPAIVAMRMKPSRATWVDSRKTRPFWTLSTIRRPSSMP